MLQSAMGYLTGADATAMAAETRRTALQVLEHVTSMGTAARTSILAAFTSAQGYCADADYSPRAWLINRTRITKGAAAAYTSWARRAAAHPRVARALAAGEMSESVARTICQWTDKLPEDCRDDADAILVAAAQAGADLRHLAELAGEIYARSLPDQDRDETFEDRPFELETTFQGAGVISGDLTPECAAVVRTVLDALSAPAGTEDTRTYGQRYHDALHEAMRRLVAGGLLPERAGQPAKVWAHISLTDLLKMEGSSALQEQWIGEARAQWAAARAGASVGGSDGAAWLDGDAAQAFACDAPITPVVIGEVNYAVLDDLVRLCVELGRVTDRPPPRTETLAGRSPAGLHVREALEQADHRQSRRSPIRPGRAGGLPAPSAARWPPRRPQPALGHRLQRGHSGWHPQRGQAARQALPLVRRLQPARLGVPGPPLRWGWTLILNPDGTTTAWNPDKTKVLRSHSPPSGAG